MSDPLRIALVAEGPTDGIVIEAVLRSILPDREFVLKQIFPEGSISFGELGAGWVGVYRWCHQAARRGNGRLQDDALLFQNFDLLILHLDADVAGFEYDAGALVPGPTDGELPCELPCPPPADTTDALRAILLSWAGETVEPRRTVICMPSKSTEAWVIASIFPDDRAMAQGIECYPNPEGRLSQQPKRTRIRKSQHDYRQHMKRMEVAWPKLASPHTLTEAYRFQTELLAELPA